MRMNPDQYEMLATQQLTRAKQLEENGLDPGLVQAAATMALTYATLASVAAQIAIAEARLH